MDRMSTNSNNYGDSSPKLLQSESSSYSCSSSRVSSYSHPPSPSSSCSISHVHKSSSSSSHLQIISFTISLLLLTIHCSVGVGLRIRRLTSIPEICANVNGLTADQLIACREQSQAVLAVSEGTRKGISECQDQFKYERWNCTPDANDNMFNKILKRGSQETAFFYAITSSGVVHTLSQTCASGNITDCYCDRRIESSRASGWKWGGCSDNIEYAMNFAKKFVDSPEEEVLKRKPNDPEAIMNLHNNQAGRLAVYRKMVKQCRCHGISGSCEVRTCWRVLPKFSEIGADLKQKYETSVKIKRHVKRRKGRKVDQGVNDEDLVYIRKSPNYCQNDVRLGILGTSGRVCNKTSEGPDSCANLCCGRGYNIQRVMKQGLCNCRFRWCCEVICEECQPKEEYIYTCK